LFSVLPATTSKYQIVEHTLKQHIPKSSTTKVSCQREEPTFYMVEHAQEKASRTVNCIEHKKGHRGVAKFRKSGFMHSL
jgi:hypothetical protein